ncbi:MAG: hypothetical protein HQ582_16220 [Planctomycetes bacterium]|nr:hypothetical protein [Planctomycetota bacterium]
MRRWNSVTVKPEFGRNENPPMLDFRTPKKLDSRAARALMFQNNLQFWLFVWMGTAIAGCASGYEQSYSDPMFAFVRAAIFGAPIHVAVVVMGWAMWISRHRVVLAGLAGGLTGFLGTWLFSGESSLLVLLMAPTLPLATGMGALGGALGGIVHQKRSGSRRFRRRVADNGVWQFTLRDLFLRMTVLAILLSASTWCARMLVDSRERAMSHDEPAPVPVEQPPDTGIKWSAESTESASDDGFE